MATATLTDFGVRNLEPDRDRQYEVWDRKVSGLGIRVSPKGAKSWVLIYRIGARSRRLTLGRYPALSLAAARDQAYEALRQIARGQDPAFAKQQERLDPSEFDKIVETFIETYAKRQTMSWAETQKILRRHFVRSWGRRNVSLITKRDVTARIDYILTERGPSAANQAFAHIRKLFNWCVERGIVETSPCQGLRMPAATTSRDRVLSEEEIARVWLAAEAIGYPYGPYVKILLLTAQRRDEVASMRWQELDLDQSVWTLPMSRTKAKRAHVVPLTSEVIACVRTLPRLDESFVFPGRTGGRSISGFSKWKRKLDQMSGTSGWTLHDLRRTAATGMAQQKVPPHVVERVLNHITGTLGGVAGVYNRFAYLDEMRGALERWQARVLAIAEDARRALPRHPMT